MQKPTKILYKVSLIVIASFLLITITVLSFTEFNAKPEKIYQLDKVKHCVAYFFLALSWMLVFKEIGKQPKIKYIILFTCIVYGIIIEVLQSVLTNYREASFLDILANSTGVLLAMLIFNKFFEKNAVI